MVFGRQPKRVCRRCKRQLVLPPFIGNLLRPAPSDAARRTDHASHLDSFRGEAALSTWLSRITLNEALGRLRRKKRADRVLRAEDPVIPAQIIAFPGSTGSDDPERMMAQRQILQLVEHATDNLPDVYRGVFMARVIEGRSVEETADLLGIRPETVKTRLHRARLMVRKELEQQIGPVMLDAFPFAGRRCERLTAAVMQRLGYTL
ncbi:RNA polymerase sigma factor [Bosea sp. MMO-172]|uniref:RNA polymerase sigma factor n=1 Tax=Bosea sp. MMO-172 TaxID=3127885 RepID=UPI0030198677